MLTFYWCQDDKLQGGIEASNDIFHLCLDDTVTEKPDRAIVEI